MQKITNAELKANARKAYDERRLTAQHGPESAFCLYHAKLDDGRDCGCAIGVSLTAETVRRVMDAGLNYSAIEGLYHFQSVLNRKRVGLFRSKIIMAVGLKV